MNEQIVLLKNGPLNAILIQVGFSNIVQIDKYIPSIQDQLRKMKYPIYDELKRGQYSFAPYSESERQEVGRWVFSSNDYLQNIIIDDGKIIYQVFDCAEYKYETFIKEFLSILEIFDTIVDISSLNRVGLRYVNTIAEQDSVSWKDLVNENFHGVEFPEDVQWHGNPLIAFSTQRAVNLNSLNMFSNFKLNIYQNSNGQKYPQDVMKFPAGEVEFFENNPLVTYVDLNHYILFKSVEKQKLYDRLETIFDNLHTVIGKIFFDSVITKKAIEIWQ